MEWGYFVVGVIATKMAEMAYAIFKQELHLRHEWLFRRRAINNLRKRNAKSE